MNIPKDYYLRLATNDYFIKFCRSNISKNELINLIDKNKSKLFTLEIELFNGSWDICTPSINIQQSRIGKYVIIHKIIDKS